MTPKEVVLKHICIANKIAGVFAVSDPAERDEIVSAAYYGLVKAATKKNPKDRYVAACICGEIKHALRSLRNNSWRNRQFLGEYLNQQGTMEERATAMGLPGEYVFRRLATMASTVPLHDEHNIASRQESQLGEMLEVCLQFLPVRLHWTFLLRFRDQYTQQEISDRTGISLRAVEYQHSDAIRTLQLHKQELADILF